MQCFLSIEDATRALHTLQKLTLHDVSRWVLAGRLAVEFHCLRSKQPAPIRQLNDIDFVAPAFDCIPETLARDFCFATFTRLIRLVRPCCSLWMPTPRCASMCFGRTEGFCAARYR